MQDAAAIPEQGPAAEPARPTLWRHRNFLLLWSGQTVSEVGSAVTQLALPLTAVVLLGATTFQVGLLIAATYAAFALIALPAGALVDRRAKRRVMIWCDSARVLIIGWIPLAAALGVLAMWQLYAVALSAGVCTVFFDVSYQSYLPVVVSRNQLVDGNGKLGATQSFAQVSGPSLGGGLVGLAGAATAMAADAVSYVVSVLSLLAIRVPAEPPRRQQRRRLRAEIGEGLSFVVRHPILRKIAACTATANLFGAMTTALEIIFLVRVLHVRPADTGLLLAAAGLGGIAGGIVSGRLARRIGSARIIWFSILVLGLPQLLVPLAEPGWRVAAFPVGFAASFFAGVVYNVAQVSYRQAICPPDLLGRMNAAMRWVVWGTLPLGGLIGGALGTALGVRATLWIAVAGGWAAGWWVFFSPLRRMQGWHVSASLSIAPVTSNAPTWESLTVAVRSGPGSATRHEVGAWAMGRLRAALGEDWPQRWHARAGRLPPFVSDPASDAVAYAQLIEMALRLECLGGTLRLRRLTREWSAHLEEIRLLHVRLQLEVAALSRSAGGRIEFETPVELSETTRPADVVIAVDGTELIAECFCVYSDVSTAEAMAYDRCLALRLHLIALDLRISGHWDVRLPDDDTARLLAEVEAAAAQVTADGASRDVTRPGIEIHLAPWAASDGPDVTLEGPATSAAGWRRARGIINGKARDWAGSPLPVWLRFDLLDGTWLFSDWAQRTLPEKTEWMAALAAQAISGTDVAGAVISCGSRIEPNAAAEDYVGTGGVVGLRRRLDALRYREIIIIPFSPAGMRHTRLWRGFYEAETHWLADALTAASLPAIEEIERGWSLPAE